MNRQITIIMSRMERKMEKNSGILLRFKNLYTGNNTMLAMKAIRRGMMIWRPSMIIKASTERPTNSIDRFTVNGRWYILIW